MEHGPCLCFLSIYTGMGGGYQFWDGALFFMDLHHHLSFYALPDDFYKVLQREMENYPDS